MSFADYVTITPNTREAVLMAYSKGLISFETMMEKLKEFDPWIETAKLRAELSREVC